MNNKRVYQCEDNIDSIFTAIYDAWDSKYGHDNIRVDIISKDNQDYNFEFFTDYIKVNTDLEKAKKVAKSIKNKISTEVYNMVCTSVCSNSLEKADIIYRFLIIGFSLGSKIIDCLTLEPVMSLHNLSRNVGMEKHHFLGFLRFVQLKNLQHNNESILFAKITPKNDIIRMIAPHFSERIMNENFVIFDEHRRTAVIHPKNSPWFYTILSDTDVKQLLDLRESQEEYEVLWKSFFDSICIKERKNLDLQRNNLPKRFRENMTEFIR